MFDHGRMDAAIAPLAERVRPISLAGERRWAAPPALAPVLPEGGLQRGWSVAVAGPGAWSLAAALVAPVQAADGWVAVVGAPGFGLVAAAGLGLRLDRVVVVDQAPPGRWAAVVAALVDGVDAVLVDPPAPVPGRDARRLRARARERGAVVVHLDGAGTWPEVPEVVLTVSSARWEGVGDGHGHLRARRVEVAGSGRRLPGSPRRTSLWLPGPDGRLAPAESGPGVGPIRPEIVGRVRPVAGVAARPELEAGGPGWPEVVAGGPGWPVAGVAARPELEAGGPVRPVGLVPPVDGASGRRPSLGRAG
jgi:hypothetical protein